jgi:hypothetical protein
MRHASSSPSQDIASIIHHEKRKIEAGKRTTLNVEFNRTYYSSFLSGIFIQFKYRKMFRKILVGATVFFAVGFNGVFSLTQEASSRRAFLTRAPVAALVSGTCFAEAATAYERRDVGDPKDRSPATAAMNEQAYKTNNRLEASGFKLDTREEEQERLSSALSSFSYESSTSSKKTGYRSGYSSTTGKTSSDSKLK